ncbi:MAG: hypothetical protein QOG93_1793, partial [Gaiellaceae bacterium]|nr:hypothetical protein [Gaiellaceae bacterium]
VGRVVQKVAGSAAFAKVAPHVVPRTDKLLHRLSGGRFVLSRAMLPSLVLTTTGAKSGSPREAPLATLPVGDAFLVVGSNFGREKHPAWTGNLLKHPEATVSFRGRRIPVTAHLLDEEEKAAAWVAEHMSKPVFSYIAGFSAPPGKTMGHAGAIISGSSGTAPAKKEALEAVGIQVGTTPTEVAQLVADRFATRA